MLFTLTSSILCCSPVVVNDAVSVLSVLPLAAFAVIVTLYVVPLVSPVIVYEKFSDCMPCRASLCAGA